MLKKLELKPGNGNSFFIKKHSVLCGYRPSIIISSRNIHIFGIVTYIYF